jgi:hypothetical protein
MVVAKAVPEDGIFNPSDTRPLSGANTDAKVFAMCIAHCINTYISDWAIRCQRGFLRGRCMLKNVVEVEARGIAASYNRNNN